MAMGNGFSPAGTALFGNTGVAMGGGLGSALQDQVAGETEEERKRRMLGLSQLQTNPLARVGSPFATPASRSLGFFGGTR